MSSSYNTCRPRLIFSQMVPRASGTFRTLAQRRRAPQQDGLIDIMSGCLHVALEGREYRRWRSLDVLLDVDIWVALLEVLLICGSLDNLLHVRQEILVSTEVEWAEL